LASTALQTLAFARQYLGYTEGPADNETPFGKWAGYDRQPWCHSFVSFILDHEGAGIGKIAYCPTGVSHFRDAGRLYTKPQVGDVFYLWFPSRNRYAHAGFVDGVSSDGWIVTVEGNSNKAGSRTGGQVVALRRKYAGTRTVFGRPAYAPPPIPKPTGNAKDIVDTQEAPGGGQWLLQRDGGVITRGTRKFYGSYFSLPPHVRNVPRQFKAITPYKGGYAIVSTKNEWYHFPPK